MCMFMCNHEQADKVSRSTLESVHTRLRDEARGNEGSLPRL